MDHSIDATRYCIDLMKDIGVAPIVWLSGVKRHVGF
jgi:hypothetical protein